MLGKELRARYKFAGLVSDASETKDCAETWSTLWVQSNNTSRLPKPNGEILQLTAWRVQYFSFSLISSNDEICNFCNSPQIFIGLEKINKKIKHFFFFFSFFFSCEMKLNEALREGQKQGSFVLPYVFFYILITFF